MKNLYTRTRPFLISLILTLLLLVSGVKGWGQAYSGVGTFTKITSLADLTDGYYVIVNSGDAFAMNNINGTNNYFGNTAVTPASGVISNPANTIVWKIMTDGTGKSIYNEASSSFVSYTGSSNAAYAVSSVTSDAQRWTFSYASNVFSVTNIASNTRILQYNSFSPRFACYTSAQQKLLLYRLALINTPTPTSLSGFTTTMGTASSSQTFTISAMGLQANLVVTAPTNFEVRENGTGTFGSTVTFAASNGTVSSKTIEVRISASAPVGTPSGNLACTSTGATTQNVALSGTVNPAGNTAPILSAPTATSITPTTATLGATVTSNGGVALTDRGTVWGTAAAPTENILSEGGTAVSSFSHVRTGFTANTLYTYRGYATNTLGTSYSPDGTFTTLHNVPTIGAGSAAAQTSFTANWSAPTGGGAATFTYEIQVDDDNAFGSPNFTQSSISSTTTSVSATSLSPGTTYYYRVRANNAGGSSAWSSISAGFATLASTVPGAPTIGTATAGNGTASVSFTAPVSDGGSTILSYTATSSPGGFTGTLTQAGSGTITVNGLTNGTAYTFTVTATNAIGTSLPSTASNSVTPVLPTVATDYFKSNIVTGNWSAPGSWLSSPDNTNWITSTLTPTDVAKEITIQSGHTITITSSVTVDQLTVNSGGKIIISSSQVLTLANGSDAIDLNVSGTIENKGTLTLNGIANFGSGSKFIWNQNGGSLNNTNVTWGTGSTVEITGSAGSVPTNLSQSFYNFTWNCPGQTNWLTLALTGSFSVGGDLKVLSTGGADKGIIFTATAGTNRTYNIAGNFIIDGGKAELTANNGIVTLNIGGNLDISSNTLNLLELGFGNFNPSGSYRSIIYLSGNLSVGTGATLTCTDNGTNDDYGNIVFEKQGIQTFTNSGTTAWIDYDIDLGSTLILNSNLNLGSGETAAKYNGINILSGGTLDCNGFNITDNSTGEGTFEIFDGGTIILSSPLGISANGATGNVLIGYSTFNIGANYTYKGSETQITGNGLPSTVNNLTINNSGGTTGVTLTNSVSVNGILSLNNGLLTTGSNTVTAAGAINNASSTSYVNGKLAQVYSAAGSKTFPLGKGGNYRPVTLNYTALSGTSTVTAEQIEGEAVPGNAPANTTLWAGRYWTINESGSSARTYSVTLDGTGFSPTYPGKIIKGNGGSTNTVCATTFATPNYTASGLNSFSNFGFGEYIVPTTTTPANEEICQGTTSVNLTATVAPVPTGGTVQFYINGSAVGSPVAVNTGTGIATLNYDPSALTANAVIRADFSGSGDFLASTSNPGNNKTLSVEATPVAGTLAKTPVAASVCAGTNVSAVLTAGSGGNGTDELQYQYDNGSWANYTSGNPLSTIGHTSVAIRTRRLASVCSASDYTTVNWTVNALPTASILSNNSPICSGSDATFDLTGTSGASVTYSLDGGSTTATATLTGGSATVTVTASTSNQTLTLVSVTDGTCSQSLSESSIVNVNALTVPTFADAGPYCSGASIADLPTTSTNGITGTWSPAIDNTQTTEYTFTPTAGQCATTAKLTITINSNTTPTFAAVGPYCSGATIADLPTTSTNGITGTWSPAISNTATIEYTFTPTAGQCATTATLTITINAAPTADAGPVQDFPVVGNLHTFTGVVATNYDNISWKQTTISGPAGTFDDSNPLIPTFIPENTGVNKFKITVTGACGSAIDSITLYALGTDPVHWSGTAGNDWHTQSNWLELTVPDATISVVIPAGLTKYPTISEAAACKDITIESGASLIDNGNFLTVSGKATVNHATITSGKWHLISSPVVGAVSGLFTDQYLRNFNTSTGLYEEIYATGTILGAMKGYALWTVADFSAPYVGSTLNSGTQSFTLSGAGNRWNLVGNPYPSSIDWDALSGWNKAGADNAIYIVNGSGWSSYVNGAGNNGGTKYIAPGQGFMVRASASGGTMTMNSGVRVHHNTNFSKKSEDAVPNLVRLQVSGNGYADEAVVRFKPEATANFDGDYDAVKMFGDVAAAAQLYSLGSTPLAINSLPETELVAVGIHVGTAGSYTIAATEINDLNYVTLEDAVTGIFTPLAGGSYTFDAVPGDYNNRFKLHFSMLSVDEASKATASIYSYQKTIYINIKDQQKGDIFVYNISGQLVKTIPSARGINEIKVPVGGNYIVKVVGRDNTSVKKVWIQQ